MKLEDRLPAALTHIADSTPLGDPGNFVPEVMTLDLRPDRSTTLRRALAVAAALIVGIAALAVVVTRPGTDGPSDEPAPPTELPGPSGALVLPVSTGMEVRFVEQGSLAGDSSVRWYATRAARPEAATYLRLFSYRNDVLAGPLGCLLPEPARESTLDNGTPVCLDERHESDPYGRVMIDRAPYAVIIEGNATDDELLVAARYVESSTTDDGFEVAPAGLPEGVEPTGAGRMVSDFAGASVAATSSPMIHVNWKDADGRSVFYVATVDQAEFVENLRLGFASVSDVTVHGAPGFIRTIEGEPTYRGVVWHESGLTYQVGSQQLTTDELLALVEQMRAATSSEWAAMVATAGAEFPTPPDTTSAVTVADP